MLAIEEPAQMQLVGTLCDMLCYVHCATCAATCCAVLCCAVRASQVFNDVVRYYDSDLSGDLDDPETGKLISGAGLALSPKEVGGGGGGSVHAF